MPLLLNAINPGVGRAIHFATTKSAAVLTLSRPVVDLKAP